MNRNTVESAFIKGESKKPTQCHLWNKEDLTAGDLDDAFDVVHIYSDDPHFSRRLTKCKQCGQLYFKEFFEEIDWVEGVHPQYVTYIPVESQTQADAINEVGVWKLQSFKPRIKIDCPKGRPRRIYWEGR